MSLELGLLILESVLLGATVVLLLFSLKEGRGRNSLLQEIGRATKVLTRHEYFLAISDVMNDTKAELLGFITGRAPKGDDEKRTRDLVVHIERLRSSSVTVRYLLPKFNDRLYIGYLYTRAGAEVRYSTCALFHDIRYTVCDDKAVVVGIPESLGQREATKKGYRIPSEGLANILKEHFLTCWDASTTYEEFVRETLKQTGSSPRLLARELNIDEEELERLASGG
jgi:hypothetical protein